MASLIHNKNLIFPNLILRVLLNLEILGTFEDVTMVMYSDDVTKLLVEFPLLNKSRLSIPQLEYLLDVTESDPIMLGISFTFSASNDSTTTDISINFPRTMPCSKAMDIPRWNPDTMLFDYLPMLENRIFAGWFSRHSFVQELQRIAAVIEFDPIDFSFVSFVLRLKQNNLFTVCAVEIRLNSFPSLAPLLALYDMQTTFTTPIKLSSVKYNNTWSPERSAREMFIVANSLIQEQAFGVTT